MLGVKFSKSLLVYFFQHFLFVLFWPWFTQSYIASDYCHFLFTYCSNKLFHFVIYVLTLVWGKEGNIRGRPGENWSESLRCCCRFALSENKVISQSNKPVGLAVWCDITFCFIMSKYTRLYIYTQYIILYIRYSDSLSWHNVKQHKEHYCLSWYQVSL